MMEKLAQAGGWGGGVHAHLLSLYLPSQTKLWGALQLRGQTDPLTVFLVYPYMYSVVYTIL